MRPVFAIAGHTAEAAAREKIAERPVEIETAGALPPAVWGKTRETAAAAPRVEARLTEQAEDDLRTLVGNTERLHAELLLDLQRLQLGTFLCEIGVDQ